MPLWWPLIVLVFAYAICRFLLLLIPPNVPSIDVDASDVLAQRKETEKNSFIYIPPRGRSQQSDKKVQCYEPATMKYLGYFPALSPDDVNERVTLSSKAQKTWALSSFKVRRQFLRILLKYIVDHQELICEVSSRDTGKTMVDASLGEIMTTCEKITWLLSEGERWLKPESRSSGRAMLHKVSRVEFHPLGVIGAIVPWNYPFHNIFNPMLAAVFSGNGIVIKVSEHASWSGCFYFRIIQAALAAVGAPENLVDVITGFAETGEALVSSVDKMIFVGSTAVGKMIMRNAAETLTPVTLELGGKDAFIICEDADVSHVAQVAVRGTLQSSGQNCAGAERFYVHKDIYTAFVSQVTKIVKSISVGPPLSGRYDMGAICLQEHSENLQNLVNDALDKGAEIAVRGSFGRLGEDAVDQYFPPTVLINVNHNMKIMKEEGPPLSGRYDMGAICLQEHSENLQNLVNDALDKGAEIAVRGSFGRLGEDAVDQYFPPTVLINVNHNMKIMKEEAFGPIMPIMQFSTDEEVIKLANDSRYALGCAVFSGSKRRAKEIASQIQCGVAAINDFASNYMCQSLPFGGVKDSGFGRFAGIEGLRACCLVKSVVEDRFWPLVKTKIPKPIQYPVAENAFEFQEALVETLYGLNIWDRLRSLIDVIKFLTDQSSHVTRTRKSH